MRDLYYLLDDDKFRGKIQKSVSRGGLNLGPMLIVCRNFYAGSMARFNTSIPAKRMIGQKAANLRAILSAIGDGRSRAQLQAISYPHKAIYGLITLFSDRPEGSNARRAHGAHSRRVQQ